MTIIQTTKYDYGDEVMFTDLLPNKLDGFKGVITAVQVYACSAFIPNRHIVSYCVDPNPGFEHDDEQWISEVNLQKLNKSV